MSNKIFKQDVIFTPADIGALFEFGEQIDEIRQNISKGSSVTAMSVEAIRSGIESGCAFTGNTVLDTINVILDYVYKAEELSSELYEKYQEMYRAKRNLCCGGEVA